MACWHNEHIFLFNKSVELLFGNLSLLKKYLLPRKCLLLQHGAGDKGIMLGAAYSEARSHGTADKGQVVGCFLVRSQAKPLVHPCTQTRNVAQMPPDFSQDIFTHLLIRAMEPNRLQTFFIPRTNQSVQARAQVPCPKHYPPALSKKSVLRPGHSAKQRFAKAPRNDGKSVFLIQGDHRSGPHPGHEPHCPWHPSACL